MSGTAELRKGWCPGALRPMMARDGLLVRLRITGGILAADVASRIADLAERHGNGLFDLSARANLQLRGVGEEALPALLGGLCSLDLVDASAAAEAVRNVIASPLAGFGSGPDIRPLAAALEAALVGDPTLHALPPKFGFLIDDGGPPDLAAIRADIRFDWNGAENAFAIGLGGTRARALDAGRCAPDELVGRAIALARRSLAIGDRPQRIHRLVEDCGADELARRFGLARGAAMPAQASEPRVAVPGQKMYGERPALGVAVPFGRLDASLLRIAAATANRAGTGDLRLTPWRLILLPGVRQKDADLDGLARAGFIVDPSDPRLRVAACTGVTGCARGTTPTHADATFLAGLAAHRPGERIALHVSGCEKGCAKPSRSAFTIVARSGRYDLVLDGRPGDPPQFSRLSLDAVSRILRDGSRGSV